MVKYSNNRRYDVGEKPTAAFVLSLVGGIFTLLAGLAIIGLGQAIATYYNGDISGLYEYGALGLVPGLLCIIGAVMLNSREKPRVRTGSALVLILTLVSVGGGYAMTGNIFGGLIIDGFFLGFILTLIGSIMGLVWSPPTSLATMAPAMATPPPPA